MWAGYSRPHFIKGKTMFKEQAFTFDGISCNEYGLMIYFTDNQTTREINLGTDIDIVEDRLSKRIDPISYGVSMNKALSFPLTFGSRTTITEDEVDEILSWLTGHREYKWLELHDCIVMCENGEPTFMPTTKNTRIRYRCHINSVSVEYIDGLPFAFSAQVECDGPFGYVYPPSETTYEIDSVISTVDFYNDSSYNGYLYPTLFLSCEGCNVLTITNISDNSRIFELDASDKTGGLDGLDVMIDCKNNIITAVNASDMNVNLYPYFNNKFLRLIKGENQLQMQTDDGSCDMTMICEFRRKVSD